MEQGLRVNSSAGLGELVHRGWLLTCLFALLLAFPPRIEQGWVLVALQLSQGRFCAQGALQRNWGHPNQSTLGLGTQRSLTNSEEFDKRASKAHQFYQF